MSIKGKLFLATGLLSVFAACAVVLLDAKPDETLRETAYTTPFTSYSPSTDEISAAPYYAMLKEWNGKLAVFYSTDREPHEVFDVYIATLPPSEQASLHNGIFVKDETELMLLLEDYTG